MFFFLFIWWHQSSDFISLTYWTNNFIVSKETKRRKKNSRSVVNPLGTGSGGKTGVAVVVSPTIPMLVSGAPLVTPWESFVITTPAPRISCVRSVWSLSENWKLQDLNTCNDHQNSLRAPKQKPVKDSTTKNIQKLKNLVTCSHSFRWVIFHKEKSIIYQRYIFKASGTSQKTNLHVQEKHFYQLDSHK